MIERFVTRFQNHIVRIPVLVLAISLALVAFGGAAARVTAQAATTTGQIRFVHALPGGPAVDILVDGTLAAHALDYGAATRYLNVPLGDHAISVQQSTTDNSGKVLLSTKASLTAANPALLVVVEGTLDTPEAGVFPQDLSPLAAGKTRLTAVHAIKDAPAIDVLRPDGSPLIEGLKYGDAFGGFDTTAGAPGLAIVASGGDIKGALIQIDSVSLNAGTQYVLVMLGTVSGSVKPSYLLLSAPTAGAADNALVRFVNGVNNGKAIDVYVNGQLIVPDLAVGDATEHLSLPTGSTTVELRSSGDPNTAPAIAKSDLSLDSSKNKAQTVVISSDNTSKYSITAFADDVSTLSPTSARVVLIDATGSNSAFTFNGVAVPALKSVGEAKSGALPPGKYDVVVAGVKSTVTLDGGTLTDLVLLGSSDSPRLVIATTGLSEQPGSVAGAATATAAPTETPSQAPTSAETVAPNAAATSAAQTMPTATTAAATLKPGTKPSRTPAPSATAHPPAATATLLPPNGGVVRVDSTAHLTIREYPSATANALASLPSQASVIILGINLPTPPITGTPTFAPTGVKLPTPTIAATTRGDIWLYVSWVAPDGGTVTGWVLSQYLDITIRGVLTGGDNVAVLETLRQIPDTTAGAKTNTNVTPVMIDLNAFIGTINTNPGVNANIRRTPNLKSEAISRIPSGATVFVLSTTSVPITPAVGAPSSPAWYFVRYDVDGASVFGWISGDFLTIIHRNKPIQPGDVPTATTITVGYIQTNTTAAPVAPAAATALPAVQTVSAVVTPLANGLLATVVNLDPSANLQLRNQPSITALSLARIPLGTPLAVLGRNGAGNWVEVQYQGQNGWVATGYIVLTKSGRPALVGDLPIVNGEPNSFGTGTPTATPTGVG